MKDQLILVDAQDQPIGKIGKLEAHLGKGKLHRAFTAILKNDKGKVLLTKRSLKKPLWPGYWDLSFSSHPWVGESLEEACIRRAQEELRIKTNGIRRLLNYQYQIAWTKKLSENEINHVLLSEVEGMVEPTPEEISGYFWLAWGKVKPWINEHHNQVAPWATLIIKKIHELPSVHA